MRRLFRVLLLAMLSCTLRTGAACAQADEASSPAAAANPYLASLDAEIKDPAVRAAIRRVQPACVRIGTASGVTVRADGFVLTAAHVAHKVDMRCTVLYPDGRKFVGNCVAIDKLLDLAVVEIRADEPMPFARLAAGPPEIDTPVVCIGQPGSATPDGELTGYQPFTVSVGRIRGFRNDRLEDQRLGGTKHDAWTYWGHSGAPVFNQQGEIVAMHNSWDPETRLRHAVTYEAISRFLRENLLASGPPVGDGDRGEQRLLDR